MPFQLPPQIEITDEQSAYMYAERMQMMIQFATSLDTTAVALQKRIITQLRNEGLDSSDGWRGMLGMSNAKQVAANVVRPLRAASAEAENIARAGKLFRANLQSLVFEPIREARQMAKGKTNGLEVK